jgi:hypothetical protein
MEDKEFLDRVQAKIERLTGKAVSVVIDESDIDKLEVELDGPVPRVQLGYAVLQYPGFARMCVEYAVASIRRERQLGTLEFHALLGRN